jgi:hypothetical protein
VHNKRVNIADSIGVHANVQRQHGGGKSTMARVPFLTLTPEIHTDREINNPRAYRVSDETSENMQSSIPWSG